VDRAGGEKEEEKQMVEKSSRKQCVANIAYLHFGAEWMNRTAPERSE
jgi:hypothetical protein